MVRSRSADARSSRWRAAWIALLILTSFLLATALQGPPARAQTVVTVQLLDTLRFDPPLIQVEPGEEVHLRVVNAGQAEHTFTLFIPPNPDVPISEFPALQAYYDATETIVDAWLQAGEEEWANFTAPMVEADYRYVCMILGHAAGGMVGWLQVGAGGGGDGPGFVWPLGLIQTILVIALAGTAVFALVYHLRTTRS